MEEEKLAEKPVPTKKRRLSRKQKGFVKDIVKGKTGVEAALNNYDTTDNVTARSIASENLTKPNIVKAIQDYLPDELLAQVHLEGLLATKLSGTGGMKLSMGADGEVSEFGHSDLEVPDYATRHKYLDSAYKLKGSYAAEKHLTVNMDFKPDATSVALANEFEEKLKAEMKK